MELYQVKAFVEVAAQGHLTRAAANLNTSQPAVSAQIKALEEELQLSLFTRTSKGMQLTYSGMELLPLAKQMIASGQEIERMAQVLGNEASGTIEMGLNENAAFLQIEALSRDLRLIHPKLQLSLRNSTSHQIQEAILNGTMECGYIFGDCLHQDLQSIELGIYRVVIAAPYSWQEKIKSATWEDMIKLPWIWQNEHCAYMKKARSFFQSTGLCQPVSCFATEEDATTLALITSELGVGLIKEQDAIEAETQGKVVIWPRHHFMVSLRFVFHKKHAADPRIQALEELIGNIWIGAAQKEMCLEEQGE